MRVTAFLCMAVTSYHRTTWDKTGLPTAASGYNRGIRPLTYWIYRKKNLLGMFFDNFGLKNHYYLHIPKICCTFASQNAKASNYGSDTTANF